MRNIAACLLALSIVSCGLFEDRGFIAENELAQITVNSNPCGAKVYIEDVLTSERVAVGRTPLRPILVPYWSAYRGYAEEERQVSVVGKLRIVVEMDGYEKFSRVIEVDNQESTHAIDVELAEISR